jgi:tetrahydromethanopterin S-methyltransferase subunit E
MDDDDGPKVENGGVVIRRAIRSKLFCQVSAGLTGMFFGLRYYRFGQWLGVSEFFRLAMSMLVAGVIASAIGGLITLLRYWEEFQKLREFWEFFDLVDGDVDG